MAQMERSQNDSSRSDRGDQEPEKKLSLTENSTNHVFCGVKAVFGALGSQKPSKQFAINSPTALATSEEYPYLPAPR
ncbi:hypothetical protein RB9462 [Rhodopirellula baltica SH 1]|uniref:Uncharacterized protein n=1 Tax=Rhodopirellula baltica (strain DSM 10527 / NCIMB 13988 / SH1) TaxID=243090 RepID=Q7ULJ7_RHOBA|nr:hypothetical protein RB9462 [Rhodopirellula baltica SH 1]